MVALKAICIVWFGLAPDIGWALAGFWALGIVNAVFHPLYDAWLNQQLESRNRSTLLSFFSQTNAIGQAGGGPLVGWAGYRFTVRASIVFSAILLLPATVILRRLYRNR